MGKSANTISSNKRLYLRNKIIKGAKLYQQYLNNKKFLIICEDGENHEVAFYKNDFKHLTGIDSDLSDKRFFDNSVSGTLSEKNIKEMQHYNYQTLKQKADRIEKINELIYENVEDSLFIIDLHTNTFNFPVAMKNININTCIGFIDSDNHARTLRKFTNSQNCKSEKKIYAIYAKETTEKGYKNIVYINRGIGGTVKDIIGDENHIYLIDDYVAITREKE